MQIDLAPTALAACGIESPAGAEWDGVNLLPFWIGEKDGAPHEALFWRFGEQMAVRRGAWKLVSAPGSNGRELYNLEDDPGEKSNLAASQRGKVTELESAWNEWSAKNTAAAWVPVRAANRRRQAR
jgi:arylsulfatase A-like enzyme